MGFDTPEAEKIIRGFLKMEEKMRPVKHSWSLVLYALLLVILSAQKNGARKITMDERSHENHLQFKHHHHHHHHHHSSSSSSHMDPSLNVFFTTNDLKVGKSMPIYFSKKDLSASPRLLPKEEADSIPFSVSKLQYLVQYFSFSKDSPQAQAIEYTLRQCELKPIKGETRFCATSLESMLEFARRVFGFDAQFKVLTTTRLTNSSTTSTTILQNYTILETPKEMFAPRMVACHTMPYPYAVFYCHCQESNNKVFQISLGGVNITERVEAVAVCHMDTSQWDRDHAAFSVLKIEPGTSPVCHFFPVDNLVWVPIPGQIK
ncbi:hypothetical protein FNV43_RR22695 [Rhamnella rubrinervis]|uniref:BURP domain-containing protein n=1 Tax=Rhamnella rubrinervis TaxID=2594499 RepID=A0A8K0DX39_9ROSA|nr:hypothetical protein FNV43_RR22695 [Rhamnella rubrinervis]